MDVLTSLKAATEATSTLEEASKRLKEARDGGGEEEEEEEEKRWVARERK